ncbi:hypothetical protein FRX31_021659, partial [Thalictrum thalictroides]
MEHIIHSWETDLNNPNAKVHVVHNNFDKSCFLDSTERSSVTKVEVSVHRSCTTAILDSGAPMTIISSKFMKRIKIAPDVDYSREYNTAGNSTTRAIGAYSSLSLRFGGLVLTGPAIVLDSDSYDILIGTKFFRDFKATISYDTNTLTVFGYSIPLIFDNDPTTKSKKVKKVNIVFADSIYPLKYKPYGKNIPSPPSTTEAKDGIPIYAPYNTHLKPGSQMILPTGIKYHVPAHLYMVAEPIPNLHHTEPRLCPGWYSHGANSLSVMVANITKNPIQIHKRQIIGYLKLYPVNDIVSIHKFGDLSDLGICEEKVNNLIAFINRDQVPKLTEEEFIQFKKVLDEVGELFAQNSSDFGHISGVKHTINTGDSAPIRQRPYRK